MIALATRDLLWRTRLVEAARATGVAFAECRDVPGLQRVLAERALSGVLVDLEMEDAPALIAAARDWARAAGSELAIWAFGAHTDREGFELARAAGAARVLARGALAARVGEIIEELERGR